MIFLEFFMFLFAAGCGFAAGWFLRLFRDRKEVSHGRSEFFRALRRLRHRRDDIYNGIYALGYVAAVSDAEECARKTLVRPSSLEP